MSCGLDICYCQSNSIIYNILYCFNTSHVTLYRKYSCQNSRRRWVSIHLMLLFIFFCILFLLSPSWFQYISCYSLSMRFIMDLLRRKCFNTSHVTLYPTVKRSLTSSMKRFNTSHVTLYLAPVSILIWSPAVSIHLMLLFIGKFNFEVSFIQEFQYISCYSLSWISWLFRLWCNSFQYISCYSLSQSNHNPRINQKKFQYISCYSLSVQGAAEMPWLISFNTSHVTLYLQQMVADADEVTFQYISCYSLSSSISARPLITSCFNTSHVTLYQKENPVLVNKLMFQYISCYSLSRRSCLIWNRKLRFNTSHVTLYHWRGFKRLYRWEVSIHLMLLFI